MASSNTPDSQPEPESLPPPEPPPPPPPPPREVVEEAIVVIERNESLPSGVKLERGPDIEKRQR
jgi:hypothetical protein